LKQSHAIHPVGPLLFGLLITQVLATIQVYLSNLNLYVMLAVAKTAGYLTVPNQQVAGSLQKITTAFLGGLFFTFSIGAGICLASLAAAWIWRRVFAKSIFVLVFFLCIWAGLLIAVNIYGWSVWPSLEHIASPALYQNINKTLLDYDYLPVNAGIGVDAIISNKNTELVFKSRGCELFQIPISRFLSDPATALHHLSRASDRHSVFRYLTFVSLLIGFPIVIYLFLHALLYYLFLAFSNPGTSALLASVMCFLIGFATFAFFQTNRIDVVSTQNVAAALGSTRWQVRVAALKAAGKNRLDISRYRGYPALLKSPVVPQRYWLARALAVSRGPGTYRDLLHLLNDANINVRCMAMYAFGQRKNPQAIGPILAKLQTSGHWYSQLYAYRALRSLGWKQRRSP